MISKNARKIDKYGSLNIRDYQEGIINSYLNTIELFDDAMIMRSFDKLDRTFSLLKLSLEEAAKTIALYEIYILIKSGAPEGAFTKRIEANLCLLEDHNSKTKYAYKSLIGNFRNYQEDNQESVFEKRLQKVKELNALKNHGFYTTLKDGKFIAPYLNISEDDVILMEHDTLHIIGYSKKLVLNLPDDLFLEMRINKDVIKKHDLFKRNRDIHKMKVFYKEYD